MRIWSWMAVAAISVAGCGSEAHRKAPPPAAHSASAPVRIEVGAGPGYATYAFGSVWVGNHQDDTVVGIDPGTNDVRTRVRVPGEPTGISAGFGSVWTFTPAGGGRIRRIDPERGELEASIPVKSPGGPLGGLTRAAGSMWMAGEDGLLVRVDPRTNRARRVLRMPKADVPCPGQMTESGGDLWLVWECGNDRILRIDPGRGRIDATIRVPDDYAVWTAGHGGRLWALTQGGKVLEIDRRGNRIRREGQVAANGSGMTYGAGALWVRAGASRLVEVDPKTLRPRREVKLPEAPVPGGGLAVGGGAVWAANFAEGTVYRLRP